MMIHFYETIRNLSTCAVCTPTPLTPLHSPKHALFPSSPLIMAAAVNVMDLVDSRSTEITAAMEAVKTNMSISYRLSVPFYMRRRAASHNPKRLPRKVRPADLDKTKPKYKYKKHTVKVGDEEHKARRLETHLWHAKRCHMVDQWGWRVPVTTTQKGDRAAYRASYSSTTLQDTSYCTWLAVSGDGLRSKLSDSLVPNMFCLNRVVTSHWYQAGACLGPVTLLWVSEKVLHMRVHPAILHNVNIDSLFPAGVQIKQMECSQFTMRGVKSLELLVKVINLSPNNPDNVREIWQGLKDDPCSLGLQKGVILGCNIELPSNQFKHFTPLTDTPISQPSCRLSPSPHLNCDLLFRDPVKVDKSSAWSPCCIYVEPGTGALELAVPAGTGTRLWVPLVYSGGRVVGLQDAHSLDTYSSLLSFPHDYPDTRAAQLCLETTGRQVEEKENRRPPQKRVNYKELGVSSPFAPDWVSLVPRVQVIRDTHLLDNLPTLPAVYDRHLVNVSVTCSKRGNLRAGSHLYTTPDHITPSSCDPIYKPGDSYTLVGYVTSGRFCLSTGRSAGIGLITVQTYRSVLGSKVLLSRNVTTRQFRRVKIDLMT